MADRVAKHGVGTIRLQKFTSHTAAMNAYNKRKGLTNNGVKNHSNQPTTKDKVAEIMEGFDGEEDEEDQEVDAIRNPALGKTCSYCKKKNHFAKDCRRKVCYEKGRKNNKNGNKGSSSESYEARLNNLLNQVNTLKSKSTNNKQSDSKTAVVSAPAEDPETAANKTGFL